MAFWTPLIGTLDQTLWLHFILLYVNNLPYGLLQAKQLSVWILKISHKLRRPENDAPIAISTINVVSVKYNIRNLFAFFKISVNLDFGLFVSHFQIYKTVEGFHSRKNVS